MQILTEASYVKLIKDISNDEVPVLMASALLRIDRHVDGLGNAVPAPVVNLVNLFRLFMKQFNTVRTLAQTSSYVEYPQSVYLDTKSINVLIRAAHESLLTFGYLSSGAVFDAEDEVHFKYLCYRHGGAVDQERVLALRKDSFGANFYSQQLAAAAAERAATFASLSGHPIFASLSGEMRNQIRDGGWRIDAAKTLGWNGLAQYATLPLHWAKAQYYVLSIYAHAGYQGIQYESTHNHDVHGLLMHLYIVASYFIALFDKRVATTDIKFTDREVAIIQEMIFLSRQTDLVVSKSDFPYIS